MPEVVRQSTSQTQTPTDCGTANVTVYDKYHLTFCESITRLLIQVILSEIEENELDKLYFYEWLMYECNRWPRVLEKGWGMRYFVWHIEESKRVRA